MRCLHEVLQLFDTASEMEYCVEFDEIKSILEYCNNTLKPFDKLQFRGGNTYYIDEIAGRLQKMLLGRHLVDEHSKEPLPKAYPMLRKIMMFLLANTDATYKYNIHDDTSMAHVYGLCPMLPRFLLVAIVWELQLHNFFYEALTYTPCWFAFQHLEAAADSLKHITDPYKVLETVEQLVRATLLSLSRSKFREMDKVDQKIIFGKMFDYTMNLLRQFYTPDAEKFKQFKKIQYQRYSGFALCHILEMVRFGFDVYEKPEQLNPLINTSIYEICIHLNKPIDPTKAKESDVLKEHTLKIIMTLLNSLQYNVMKVNIDTFINWVEVDITPNVNLQMAIGELSYKVWQRMLANPTFDHDLKKQLQLIALRPKTEQEKAQLATLGDILRSLDEPLEPHDKKDWYNELFKRPMALISDECLECIKEHRKLMCVENAKNILYFLKEEVDLQSQSGTESEQPSTSAMRNSGNEPKFLINMDDHKELISVLLLSLENFSNEHIVELLEYQINLFGASTTICCRVSEFEKRSTVFFNKLTDRIDTQTFLILCFENPSEMWEKYFDYALENGNPILFLCMIAEKYPSFSEHYIPALLQKTFATSEKIQTKSFPEMLCIIYHKLYYANRQLEFLKDLVNKTIIRLVDSENFDDLKQVVTMLNMINWYKDTQSFKPLNFGKVTAPILYTSALILERTRWDPNTYTSVRDSVVCDIIRFIQAVSKKFLPFASEKDRKWIAMQVKSLRPMTQFYFQKFSLAVDQPQVHFGTFLMRLNDNNITEEEFLLYTLSRCTKKEGEWLGRSTRLLPFIPLTMNQLGARISDTCNINVLNNYRHVLASFANIVKTIMLPDAQKDLNELVKLVKVVLKVIESTPQQLYEDTFLDFVRLLEEILQANHCGLTTNSISEIEEVVHKIKDCFAKQVFLDKLQIIKVQLE